MRTGQRDVHITPKRRLSISYEELETLKKSIKVSVINELRAEMEGLSDQESLKDTVLSEIRTELMGIPNPALLKASILNELKMDMKTPRNDPEAADRRLKEIAGVQDGLLRELLDQKTVIKKLENEIEKLTKQLEDMKSAAQAPAPSFSFIPHDDPLDLPPLSKKPKQHTPEFRNETPAAYDMNNFREAPAPLPGTNAKVHLKFREIEPRELDEVETAAKCEYIIAESGDKRPLKANVTQRTNVTQQPVRAESVRQSAPRQQVLRQPAPPKADYFRSKPVDDYKPADNHKCEYIIAEKVQKKHMIEESVDFQEHEDAELITCCRKSSRTY